MKQFLLLQFIFCMLLNTRLLCALFAPAQHHVRAECIFILCGLCATVEHSPRRHYIRHNRNKLKHNKHEFLLSSLFWERDELEFLLFPALFLFPHFFGFFRICLFLSSTITMYTMRAVYSCAYKAINKEKPKMVRLKANEQNKGKTRFQIASIFFPCVHQCTHYTL